MSKAKEKRLESKKRKIEAFLNVAKMNDEDERRRQSLTKKPKLEEKTEKETLNSDALEDLRRQLKERKKKLQAIPNFTVKTKGRNALLEIPEDLRTPLVPRDLQHLLLYALMGSKAPVEPSKWCQFQQWSKLTQIIFLAIDNLGAWSMSSIP